LAVSVPLGNAQAAKSTFSVLYTFTGGDDGANPLAGLIADKQGNLYDTAEFGGANGVGTVFELAPNGSESVLLTFDGTNGRRPGNGNLINVNGTLYGTTITGGTGSCYAGCGTVFSLNLQTGAETVLYNFLGGSDGLNPIYGLVADKHGDLYGTTYEGGSNNHGVVFKIAPDGTETVLYTFCSQANCADGTGPYSQPIIDKSGNLYGTTTEGGADGGGTVFEITPGGTETVLHSFLNGAGDGTIPFAGVIADKNGNLYGTTVEQGAYNCGAVYKVTPGGDEAVLYSFQGGNDGMSSKAALVQDKDGNLYGTTTLGGSSNDGIVFKVAPNGTETILHTFTGGSDGGNSYAALRLKGAWLYGTAENGGADGYGTVFKVKK
jgi:uncharacterized repeat protein (TIGR03803 family)